MMIKKILIVCGLLFCSTLVAQNRIKFEYDQAGNQVKRYICLSCPARMSGTKDEGNAQKEEDLQKFFPEDVISYYPNPVKEQLYLQWDLPNENKVKQMMLFSINGQQLREFKGFETQNNTTISFQEYPSGTYIIVLDLTNGEQKSITILKQ